MSLLTTLQHLENSSESADDCISPNSEISRPNSEEINSDTTANGNEQSLNEEEIEDPLKEYRSPASETCLERVIPDYPVIMEEDNANNSSTGREVYNIAPGENKHPASLMTDKRCEELAFPHRTKSHVSVFLKRG